MAEVGRDLWRSSGPSTLFKESNLDAVVQDHVQTAFGLQGWRLHNLPRQPVPVLSQKVTVKKCFVMFRRNLCDWLTSPSSLSLSS